MCSLGFPSSPIHMQMFLHKATTKFRNTKGVLMVIYLVAGFTVSPDHRHFPPRRPKNHTSFNKYTLFVFTPLKKKFTRVQRKCFVVYLGDQKAFLFFKHP